MPAREAAGWPLRPNPVAAKWARIPRRLRPLTPRSGPPSALAKDGCERGSVFHGDFRLCEGIDPGPKSGAPTGGARGGRVREDLRGEGKRGTVRPARTPAHAPLT